MSNTTTAPVNPTVNQNGRSTFFDTTTLTLSAFDGNFRSDAGILYRFLTRNVSNLTPKACHLLAMNLQEQLQIMESEGKKEVKVADKATKSKTGEGMNRKVRASYKATLADTDGIRLEALRLSLIQQASSNGLYIPDNGSLGLQVWGALAKKWKELSEVESIKWLDENGKELPKS